MSHMQIAQPDSVSERFLEEVARGHGGRGEPGAGLVQDKLARRLKKNSSEAFEELVRTYGQQLLRVAVRILGNREDAEEALQTAFLKIFKAVEEFRGDSSLYSWLYRIVVNEALSKGRARKGYVTVPVEDHRPRFENGARASPVHGWNSAPDSDLEFSELQRFYLRCVKELPEKYRLPYILKDMEELTEKEVSQTLQLPISTLKSRIHRARLAIRRRVEDQFGGLKESRAS